LVAWLVGWIGRNLDFATARELSRSGQLLCKCCNGTMKSKNERKERKKDFVFRIKGFLILANYNSLLLFK
jgi:hypothetical protein